MSFQNMQRINLTKGVSGIFVNMKQSGNATLSCEECSMRFTVFKRKKQCSVCLRFYCGNCLVTQMGEGGTVLSRYKDKKHICGKCLILTARPLSRVKLQQLRVKDLQQYLMSQHISTRGCVEKDDLVNLLLRHVAYWDSGSRTERPNTPFGFQSQTDLSSSEQSSFHQQENSPESENNRPSSIHGFPPFTDVNTRSSGSDEQASAPSVPVEVQGPNSNSQGTATSAGAGDTHSPEPLNGQSDLPRSMNEDAGEPMDFEIVEMTDWDGEVDGSDQGPVPVVEETSERVSTADSSSCASIEDLDEGNIPTCSRISLATIGSLEELEALSVKQVKELLSLNRVDYRGCCEKAELMERARRLWQEYYQSRKEVENMAPNELCKICMDAPIECVMLECGHMATCMTCGKQLSECPICRQYVVRVVRTFRA